MKKKTTNPIVHLAAVADSDRDADADGREMEMHLKFLRPAYDLIGQHTHTSD
jgi:hypothetical protein